MTIPPTLHDLALGSVLLLAAAAFAAGPVDIASRRELFVDRFLIDRLDAASLRLHHPRREGVALQFDRPWEGGFSAYITVFRDAPLVRMYYRGRPMSAKKDNTPAEVTCYAESKDGVTWRRPKLGLVEVAGSKDNNVILAEPPFTHNFAPFIDTRPGVGDARRYKALGGSRKSGLVAFVSADALRWKKLRDEPVITQGAFDSQNVAFWSDAEKCYVCYFRTWKRVGKKSYRWISRTTSADFLTWTKPVEMTFGDAPAEHLYTNATLPYFRAPHIYVAMPKRFFPGRPAVAATRAAKLVPDPEYRRHSSDAVFMTSRGGSTYDRTFLQAFIRPGPSPRDWVCRDNTPAWGIVPADERTMYLYRLSHYAQPTAHVTRYSLRTDGFVSVHARCRTGRRSDDGKTLYGGQMLTRPLTFAGSRLEINAATGAGGGLRVEIRDDADKPIPGYALADCPPFRGDEIAHVVAWKAGADVSKLAGRTVRLRVELIDADLYALRFR